MPDNKYPPLADKPQSEVFGLGASPLADAKISRMDVRGSQNTLIIIAACSGRMGPYPVASLRPDNCGHVKA
jgi:hypothetical protein